MEVEGILKMKTNERSGVSKNGPWKMADYVLEIPGMYPRHISFAVSDGVVARFAQFDAMIGKEVTVLFEIDAREYDGKWFNDIRAYGIRAKQQAAG